MPEEAVETNIAQDQIEDWGGEGTNYEIVDDEGNPTAAPVAVDEASVVQPNQEKAPSAKPNIVDESGNPVVDQEKPAVNSEDEKPEPLLGFDSMFATESGDFDGQKGLDFLSKNNAFAYKSTFVPTEKPAESATPTEDVPAWKTEVTEWGKKMKEEQLGPLTSVWTALQQSGAATEGMRALFDNEYIAREKAINELIEDKRMNFLTNHSASVRKDSDSVHELNEMKKTSERTQKLVAADLGGVEQYNQLLFGYTDAAGKNVRGYGADVIDWMFDQSGPDTKGMDAKEYQDAYSNWWTKISSNESSLRMIAKISTGLFSATNQPRMQKAYRKAWDAEQDQKRRGISNSPQSAQNLSKQAQSAAQGSPEIARMLGIS